MNRTANTTGRARRYLIRLRLASIALCPALVLVACADDTDDSTSSGSPYYEGKTIEIIVAAAPGGGQDNTARLLMELLEIEGDPEIRINNIEGADGLNAINDFARRDPDGLTLLQIGGTANVFEAFDHPDMEFSYDDGIPIVGATQGAVVYARPDAGIDDPADLLDPAEPLIYGGRSPEGPDYSRLFALEILGADVEAVWGFEGSGPTRIAFEQGEINLNSDTTSAYVGQVQPLVDEGIAVPLFTAGVLEDGEIVRDPSLDELPHLGEVYEDLNESPPDGIEWEVHKLFTTALVDMSKVLFAHADAPPEAVAALQDAVKKLPEHPDYQKGIDEIMGGYDLYGGTRLEEAADRLTQLDPEVVEWIKTRAADTQGAIW